MMNRFLKNCLSMFGLVKSHEFFVFSHDNLMNKIKDNFFSLQENLNLFLIKYTGYTFSNFSDAFSASSLVLILIKLLFRIVGENTTWQLNLFLLLFGIIIALKGNLIEEIRRILREFWKKVLGIRFYFQQSPDFDPCIISYYEEEFNALPKVKKINLFFQEIFYFLILIRLFILSEVYLFILVNLVLTYFLLVNKYLLLSSCFSAIIALSRFTFHLSDHSIKDFITVVHPLVNLEENESLKPTYENAQFVSLLIVRFFDEKIYERYCINAKNWNKSADFDGKGFFDENLISNYLPTAISFSQINFKEKYSTFLFFCFHEENETEEKTRENIKNADRSVFGKYLNFSSRIVSIEKNKNRSEKFNKKFIYYKEAKEGAYLLFSKKPKNIWFKLSISVLLIFLGFSFFGGNEGTVELSTFFLGELLKVVRVPSKEIVPFRQNLLENSFVPLSGKSDAHDYVVYVTTYGLYFHTLTTIREPDAPDLGKVLIEPPYGITASGSFAKITKKMTLTDIVQYLNKYPEPGKHIINPLEKASLTHFDHERYILAKKFLNPVAFNRVHRILAEKFQQNRRVQHTSFRQIRNAYFEKNSTGKSMSEALALEEEYYAVGLESNIPEMQRLEFHNQYTAIQVVKTELGPIFPGFDSPLISSSPSFEESKFIFREVINAAKKGQGKPFFNIEQKTISTLKGTTVLHEKENNYCNLRQISKDHGGLGGSSSSIYE